MNQDHVILALYNGLTTAAFLVFVVASIIFIRKILLREFDTSCLFSFTLSTGWLGTFILRCWASNIRYYRITGQEFTDLLHSYVLYIGCILVMASAILHIHMLTSKGFRHKGWKIATSLIGFVIIASYLILEI